LPKLKWWIDDKYLELVPTDAHVFYNMYLHKQGQNGSKYERG